ncbi:MAG: CGNR zinc finger domain-containing protein [Peptococcaceae bacterium]|nr:CGNR zinc finger domain-containing protein [Peptococcaceae bacterium]
MNRPFAYMKQALIDVAKTVIRDEVGYNIGGMRPHYDISTMSPVLEIQDLLTGIFVSIFFMRPGVELYRKCNNPSCDRLFLVNATSARRKYCSSSCRNANAQRAHRFRKLSSV